MDTGARSGVRGGIWDPGRQERQWNDRSESRGTADKGEPVNTSKKSKEHEKDEHGGLSEKFKKFSITVSSNLVGDRKNHAG